MKNINIYWEGSYSLEDVLNKTNDYKENENTDYGIYQIYGSHPVYGNDVLLYIGKAVQQTFSTRINQEKHWQYNKDTKNIKIYFGRLIGNKPSNIDEWNDMIGKAEEILINYHIPAHNSSNINTVKQEKLANTHILNWGQYRSLSAEVSSMQLFDETQENDDYFSLEDFK